MKVLNAPGLRTETAPPIKPTAITLMPKKGKVGERQNHPHLRSAVLENKAQALVLFILLPLLPSTHSTHPRLQSNQILYAQTYFALGCLRAFAHAVLMPGMIFKLLCILKDPTLICLPKPSQPLLHPHPIHPPYYVVTLSTLIPYT